MSTSRKPFHKAGQERPGTTRTGLARLGRHGMSDGSNQAQPACAWVLRFSVGKGA